jgi:hypothetical protein
MSGAEHILGNVCFGPARSTWTAEDAMAASIVRLDDQLTKARGMVLKLRRERAAQDALIDELRAEVALLREERAILQKEFAGVIEGGTNTAVPSPSGGHGCPSDLSPRTTLETVAFLRKFNLWRRGGYDQQPPRAHEVGEAIDSACDHIERMEREIEGLRDALCEYKCRDKAAADGGWGNI